MFLISHSTRPAFYVYRLLLLCLRQKERSPSEMSWNSTAAIRARWESQKTLSVRTTTKRADSTSDRSWASSTSTWRATTSLWIVLPCPTWTRSEHFLSERQLNTEDKGQLTKSSQSGLERSHRKSVRSPTFPPIVITLNDTCSQADNKCVLRQYLTAYSKSLGYVTKERQQLVGQAKHAVISVILKHLAQSGDLLRDIRHDRGHCDCSITANAITPNVNKKKWLI